MDNICQFTFLLVIQTVLLYGLLLLSGLILKFIPPKKNKFYGFRTRNALISDENWKYAQDQASTLILIISPLFFTISILIKFFSQFNYTAFGLYNIIDILLIIIAVVMVYFLTEDKLRKKLKNEELEED